MSIRRVLSNDLTVVMYHYVRDIEFSRYPGIKGLETFEFVEQVEFLNAEFNIVSMEHVLRYYSSGNSLPEKAMLLTFDDGYAEHFTNVYPILKNLGVQGSFFVPAKAVQKHKVLDVNKIHFILASCPESQLIINIIEEEVMGAQEEFALDTYEHYYYTYAVHNRFDSQEVIFVKRMLQHALPAALRTRIINRLFDMFVGISEEAFSRELYLRDYQLKEMIAGGMHIGCHGYDHYWWDKLSADMLEQEIDMSLKFLSSLGLNLSSWTACYPYGSCSKEVVKILKRKGCRLALTTVVAKANLQSDHLLRIPRLDTNDFPPRSQRYELNL